MERVEMRTDLSPGKALSTTLYEAEAAQRNEGQNSLAPATL